MGCMCTSRGSCKQFPARCYYTPVSSCIVLCGVVAGAVRPCVGHVAKQLAVVSSCRSCGGHLCLCIMCGLCHQHFLQACSKSMGSNHCLVYTFLVCASCCCAVTHPQHSTKPQFCCHGCECTTFVTGIRSFFLLCLSVVCILSCRFPLDTVYCFRCGATDCTA